MLLLEKSQMWAVLNHKRPFGLRNLGFVLMWGHWRLLSEEWPNWGKSTTMARDTSHGKWCGPVPHTIQLLWRPRAVWQQFQGQDSQERGNRFCEKESDMRSNTEVCGKETDTHTQTYIHTSHTHTCTHNMYMWTYVYTPHRHTDMYTHHTCLHTETCISI